MKSKNSLLSAFGTLALLISIATSASSAQAHVVGSYGFPVQDPILATLTIELLQGSARPQIFTMPALPGRDQVALFENRAGLEVALFQQPQPAPLIYLVPGIGGTPTEGGAQYLAQTLFKQGFTVVVVHNPFSWQFVLSRGPDAVPGFLPDESRELYSYLKEVSSALDRRGVRSTSVSLVGYSLGAINAGFMALQDRKEGAFNFKRVVLMNPPLDLNYALNTLDKMSALASHLTYDEYNLLWGTALRAGAKIRKQNNRQPHYFENVAKSFPLTSGQAKILVGDSFHKTLGDILFVSQQVHDRGLLKVKATKYLRNDREAEAMSFNFNSYVSTLASPYWQAKKGTHLSQADFIAEGSLTRVMSQLASDPKVMLMHNEDDFLSRPSDIKLFDDALGSRSVVFPSGGHLGNVWYPENQKQLIDFLEN